MVKKRNISRCKFRFNKVVYKIYQFNVIMICFPYPVKLLYLYTRNEIQFGKRDITIFLFILLKENILVKLLSVCKYMRANSSYPFTSSFKPKIFGLDILLIEFSYRCFWQFELFIVTNSWSLKQLENVVLLRKVCFRIVMHQV